jgi:hypothetical protein
MTDYVKITDFATKDTLTPGDPLKKVRGVEINAEFVAIQAAVGSKLDKANPAMTGSPTAPNPAIDSATTQLATTRWVRDLINVIEPLGTVKAFVGSLVNIPAGWALCNGASGTVNLTDRFIAAYGGGVFGQNGTAGHTPGAATLPVNGTSEGNGSHAHATATGGTALTVEHLPPHNHPPQGGVDGFVIQNSTAGANNGTGPGTPQQIQATTGNTGGGVAHAHPISADGFHVHAILGASTSAPVPGFFALAFIQKIALL